MDEVIVGPDGYVVMVAGVPHTVDKTAKLCSCGAICDAPSAVNRYFKARSARACPICNGPTSRHPTLVNAWVCIADKTHYWTNRALINRARWGIACPPPPMECAA